MGGTYTWKRKLPLSDPRQWEAFTTDSNYNGGAPVKVLGTVNQNYGSTQETTSYRSGSGGKGMSIDEAEDDFLLSGRTTAADRFAVYRRRHGADHGSSTYDRGHEFRTSTKFLVCRHVSADAQNLAGGRKVHYTGPVVASNRFMTGPDHWYGTTAPGMSSWYGTQAINATRPTNPSQDIAVNLAELKREGLPHMQYLTHARAQTIRGAMHEYRRTTRSKGKRAAEEWLAGNFGWLPIISAVQDLASVAARYNDILKQYHRDEGRLIRRSFQFPEKVTITEYSNGGPGEVQLLHNISSSNLIFKNSIRTGTRHEYLITRESYKFTGAFMYKLPPVDSLMGQLSDLQKLTGYQITPEVLWNLAPWSWLSDWNWNIGTLLSNAQSLSSDGLVLAYGYLTRKFSAEHHNDVTGPNIYGYGPSTWPSAAKNEEIQRIRANPYGFSTNPSAYTLKQWSILGALGLTKAPNALW